MIELFLTLATWAFVIAACGVIVIAAFLFFLLMFYKMLLFTQSILKRMGPERELQSRIEHSVHMGTLSPNEARTIANHLSAKDLS